VTEWTYDIGDSGLPHNIRRIGAPPGSEEKGVLSSLKNPFFPVGLLVGAIEAAIPTGCSASLSFGSIGFLGRVANSANIRVTPMLSV